MVVNDMANALLLDHAAGSLPEPLSLAVSTHIAINAEARAKYDALNEMGGYMIEDIEPVAVNDNALDALMARLEGEDKTQASSPVGLSDAKSVAFDTKTRAMVPGPLRAYLPDSLDKLNWKSRGPGVREYMIDVKNEGFRVSLLQIEPGKAIPAHTHKGREYTVILDGAYEDEGMIVQMGDLVCNDEQDEHRPVADPDLGCLCLAVTDAPLHFKGPLGWIINPFLK